MKKIIFVIASLMLASVIFAQSPESFSYQAIVRDDNGQPLSNTSVTFRFNIHQGSANGSLVYSEDHSVTTNDFGLVNLQIGQGTVNSGDFATIDWGNDAYFLNVRIDQGSGFVDMGTQQFISVPYAMYAKNAGSSGVAGNSGDIQLNKNGKISADPDLHWDFTKNKFTVGQSADDGRMIIQQDANAPDTIPILEVKNKAGQTVFVVYPNSVQVYVDPTSGTKSVLKGGFAVSGRSGTEASRDDYLLVRPDSTRIYFKESDNRGVMKGGFAVSGRSGTKAGTGQEYFNISPNNTANIINPSEARILWYPKKDAFMAGQVLVESADSVGQNSWATGYESKAIGDYSQALGYKTTAEGSYSFVTGYRNRAIGSFSQALGCKTLAEGSYSFSSGYGSKATGDYSQALGYRTVAEGDYSMAIGDSSNAIGTNSFAFGGPGRFWVYQDTAWVLVHANAPKALSQYSFAFGMGAISDAVGAVTFGSLDTASGQNSIAMGYRCSATDIGASAFGYKARTTGGLSVAIGYEALASGTYASAIGPFALSNGWASTAMGVDTKAYGTFSAAIGSHTIAKSYGVTVVGDENDTSFVSSSDDWVDTDPIFVIGNGYHYSNGHNAVTVLKNGNVGINTNTADKYLTVRGDARITGDLYYGTANDIYSKPDFVFKPDYTKHFGIDYIEKYINRHGHLPWLTAAKDEKDGINMTRMSFQTLEAVENQQLQIIQLRKENQQLKDENKAILKRLERIEKRLKTK